VHYQMHIWGREGLLASIAVVAAPLVLLAGLVRLLPPWGDNATPSLRGGAA
jgi:hypothetical protein